MLKLKPRQKGFTLMDVLVGVALLLIVFLGIFGAYQLGIKAIGQARNKITATAIANQQIEQIRNLPYESIGVSGSFPDGVLEASTAVVRNGTSYAVETRVDFVVDSADGIAMPEDECPNDYKKVEVSVSWGGKFASSIKFATDVAPKNMAQECSISGGILFISVFDAYGTMVQAPSIEIRDPETEEVLKTATPMDGEYYFSLTTSTYKVVVSKPGYSTERTYGTDEVATPEKPHIIILKDQYAESSFSIDEVGSFSVNTLSPWGQDDFSDSFQTDNYVSGSSNVAVGGGEATLATSSEGYLSSGYLISSDIVPSSIINWDTFSFEDLEPFGTNLGYHIFYATNSSWLLVPESDLPGNADGFDLSPVDLSGLNINKYSILRARADFSTESSSTAPVLYSWQISWITSQATPIPNKTFNLQGIKIIGTDVNEQPIYKYSQDHTTNSLGQIVINNLEWDAYTFSIDPSSGLDLESISPSPQPVGLTPGSLIEVDLYLDAENSFLLALQNQETLEPVFAAECRLYNSSLGYDVTQYTDSSGQTYFIPLSPGSYSLEIQAAGYLGYSGSVSVSGDANRVINIEQVE